MSKELSKEQVKSVYSGRDGRCCCGCSGTHADEGERSALWNKVLKVVNEGLALGHADVEDTYVSVVVGKRLYIAYTK